MAYSGPIVDPFRIPAPDGQVYFKVIGPPRGLINGYRILDAEMTRLRARRDPIGKAQFIQVGNILRFLRAELDVIGKQTAAAATANILRHIRATAVRPDQGRKRPVRLADAIVSRPIATTLPAAGVGIADIGELDKVVGPDGTPFWAAQEFGSDHIVGARVVGWFEPSHMGPDPAAFRQDADFVPSSHKGTPMMIVKKPIEERGFLRQGVEDAARTRIVRLNTVQSQVVASMRAASRGASVSDAIRAARRGRGRLGR